MGQPLKNIKVLDFTHVVMGPTASLILADMGAEVIHIEPLDGDQTRKLSGFGAGIFSFYNRNKKSLAIDLKSKEGKKVIFKMCEDADVLIENFGYDTFNKLGFSYETIKELNPKLVYCSLKGFLNGPYEKRVGMDEIAQMMGGLAYMTGKEGEPTRAGASVLDITGGMFGVIAILTALLERHQTGAGKLVKSGLFETCAFMMGQFMAGINTSVKELKPMPNRAVTWAIYQLFDTRDTKKIFIGIVSDKQWFNFCEAFEWFDLAKNDNFSSHEGRLTNKDYIIEHISKSLSTKTFDEIAKTCSEYNVPFAQVGRPQDLFDNPHLIEGNHMFNTTLFDGYKTLLPKLPISYGTGLADQCTVAPDTGQHTHEILNLLGYDANAIKELEDKGVVKT